MRAVTHLEKVITGEVSAVTHLEKVIAEETSAVTYTEKVIAGEATPITHLQKVIAGVASPVTHLEQVWAGGSPTPSEHEYTGAVPVTITANGQPLLDYTIYGNTVQSATPSPDSPIMPQGTGEKTENLFDKTITDGIILRMYINQSGQQVSSQNYYISYPLKVEGNAVYTWNFNSEYGATHNAPTVAFYDNNNNQIGVATHNNSILHFTFTTPNNCAYIRASVYVGKTTNTSMLLEGGVSVQDQTVIPFIPYGIKIPISSNSTTMPVYLGEVETTRKIKKYVFTGEESGTIYSTSTSRKGIEITGITGIIGGNADIAILAICTHYQPDARTALYRNTDSGISNSYQNDNIIFYDASYQTVEAFQQFCTQQYSAGTPVTIWYVLATPETAVVNEPLMKIGDYADTVSMEQAGVSIPTLNGQTVVDVDTTLKPSEVYIKYKG